MVTQPRRYVEPPSFTPLPFGLLSSLATEIRSPADVHWRNGVNYESLCAQVSTTYDSCFAVTGTGGAPAALPVPKEPTADMEKRGATPFTIYAEVDCSAPGFWDRAQEMTEQALGRAEESGVELALWRGQPSLTGPGAAGAPFVFPHLAADEVITDGVGNNTVTLQTAATVVSGTYDVVEGLGRLEDALAECYHGVGVIHVPRVLAPALAESMLLVRDGPRYRTPNGNIIVLGSGYDGSAPDGGTSITTAYVYATGNLFIYRGPVDTTPAISTLDRSSNLTSVIAERTYVIGWECCHLAVNISLGGAVTGAPLGVGQ